MSPHALEVLEFRAALKLVGGHAASALGRAAVEALVPHVDPEVVRSELGLVAEGIAVLGADGG